MTDAPRAYLYRYADPLTGRPVWRRDGELWNGQQPTATIPLYDQQSLDAAREEGRRAGLKEAAIVIECLLPEGGAAEPQDKTDRLIDTTRREDVRAFRALSPTPADPVAEAARVSRVFVHEDNVNGNIFIFTTLGDDGEKLASEITRLNGWTVFDYREYQLISVEAALRALAQNKGE
jgi:hypothetical protein